MTDTSFVWYDYLIKNPLLQLCIKNESMARQHWISTKDQQYGVPTLLDPGETYDWIRYSQNYASYLPDSVVNFDQLFEYWLDQGLQQNQLVYTIPRDSRLPDDFDWRIYLLLNPDLQDNKIHKKEDVITHWIKYGCNEHRKYQLRRNEVINLIGSCRTVHESLNYWLDEGLSQNVKLTTRMSQIYDSNYFYDYCIFPNHMDQKSINIGLLIHLSNFKEWSRLLTYIRYLLNIWNLTIMINLKTLDSTSLEQQTILQECPNAIVTQSKKDDDLSGFATQIKYIQDHNLKLDYILKLGDKHHDSIHSLIYYALPILNAMQIHNDIGIVGPDNFKTSLDHYNDALLIQLCQNYGILAEEYMDQIEIIETEIDLNFMLDQDIDLQHTYEVESNSMIRNFQYSYWNCKNKNQIIQKIKQHNPNFKNIITNPQMIMNKAKYPVEFILDSMFWIRFDILKQIKDWDMVTEDQNILKSLWDRFFGILAVHNGTRIMSPYELNQYIVVPKPISTSKTLCIFVGHQDQPVGSRYWSYFDEMNQYYQEIKVVLSGHEAPNIKCQISLKWPQIQVEITDNYGYDALKWYQVTSKLDLSLYHEIALVNDSCTTINTFAPIYAYFREVQKGMVDVWGITDSYEVATSQDPPKYHICSFFRVFSNRGLYFFNEFIRTNFIFKIKYKNINILRRNVIRYYEIALCEFLIASGLKLEAYYKVSKLIHLYPNSLEFTSTMLNQFYVLFDRGIPLIKNKYLLEHKFNLDHLIHFRRNLVYEP